MLLTSLFFCIVLFYWLGYLIFKRSNDALNVGVIFALLFIVTYPLKFIASAYGYYVMDVSSLDVGWWYLSTLISTISGVMFLAPFLLVTFSNKKMGGTTSSIESNLLRPSFILVASTVTIAASFGHDAISALLYFSLDAQQSRIEERAFEREGSGLLAFMRDIGLALLIIAMYRYSIDWRSFHWKKKGRVFLGILLLSFIFLSLSGSKQLALTPIVTFFLCLHIQRVRAGIGTIKYRHLPQYVLLGLILIGSLGYIRGFGSIVDEYEIGVLGQIFIQLSNAFDGPDNLAFILSRVHDFWIGDLSFQPTIQYLFGWFPRILWPDKPLVMGNLLIMQEYLWERFSGATGEVISPSMPGEMIVSAGFFFMLIWSFFLGCIFLIAYRLAHQRNVSLVTVCIYIWLWLNVFNVLRSGTGIIGSLLVFIAASCCAYGFIFILGKVLRMAITNQSNVSQLH